MGRLEAGPLRRRAARALGSLIGRNPDDRRPPAPAPPSSLLELARSGPAPLSPRGGAAGGAGEPISIAAVIPSFRRGSGGHQTIATLLGELQRRGHAVSLWLDDCDGRHAQESPQLTARSFREFFGADRLPLHTDFRAWGEVDVVLATGWQTVSRALLLPGAAARAYLVQDHEPEFYGTSAEALWAAQTYREGMHCIAASRWLAELLRERYAASATHFDLAIDHTIYRVAGEPRREDLVVFYARAVTSRRAVPLGLLALAELSRRRSEVEIALYGEGQPLPATFPHRHLGTLEPRALSALYREAAAGMVLSLTNPSLIGLEMMACGLPCVELASPPMLHTFGRESPLELASADPLELCAALERLLDDPARREHAARGGVSLAGERTWESAAGQVERGLLAALGRQGAEQLG